MQSQTKRAAVAAINAMLVTAVGAQPASFRGLGSSHSQLAYSWTEARSVSPDGHCIAGVSGSWYFETGSSPRASVWCDGAQVAAWGGAAGADDKATGVANGGTAGVGTLYGNAYGWSPTWGDYFLPGSPPASAGPQAITPDGAAVAGWYGPASTRRGFRWLNGALSVLPPLEGHSTSSANDLSDDAAVAVGKSLGSGTISRAVLWDQHGVRDLYFAAGANDATANAVSSDGFRVIGSAGGHAINWSLGCGPEDLDPGTATAISGDGFTVAGNGVWLWNPQRWWYSLADELAGYGIDLTGWQLGTINGLSQDGTTIVGTGKHRAPDGAMVTEGWVATIPQPCVAPIVNDSPPEVRATVGAPTTLAVCAFASGPVSYQWNKDGAPLSDNGRITGAQSAQLTIDPAVQADSGAYELVMTNPCGTATTPPIAYTVYCPSDFNQDGFVDGIDYDTFMNLWEAGDSQADYNHDGFVDGIDYDSFANAFEAGC